MSEKIVCIASTNTFSPYVCRNLSSSKNAAQASGPLSVSHHTNYRNSLLGQKAPSLQMRSVCLFICLFVCFCMGRAFEITQYSPYYLTVLYTQNGRRLPGLFVLNKRLSSRGITFTCAPFFSELKLWQNVCFSVVDSSRKETGEDRNTVMR